MPEKAKVIVYVVDDDASVRKAISRLLRAAGLDVQAYATGREFLDSDFRTENTCLILDIRMPDLNGFDLQRELLDAGSAMPVIFITAHNSPESREEARRLGAMGYFQKPVDEQALLDAVLYRDRRKTSPEV